MESMDFVDLIEGRPDAILSELSCRSEDKLAFRRFKYLWFLNRLMKMRLPMLYIPSNGRFALLQLGAMKNHKGMPMLSGISSVRAIFFAVTVPDFARVSIFISGEVFIGEARPVLIDSRNGVSAWMINIWFDACPIPPGRHKLWIKVFRKGRLLGQMRRFVGTIDPEIVLERCIAESQDSDSFVTGPVDLGMSIDDYVMSRPAAYHRPRSKLFSGTFDSILVVRADQLGDVSASLPAFKRLREMFKTAKITVVSQAAVIPLLRASGVADDFVDIRLDYSFANERRFMTSESRSDFEGKIKSAIFDIAIDLSPGHESQELLLLCNARYRVGFKPERFPFLDFGIEVTSRDKVNGKSVLNHAAHVSMLVTALQDALDQMATPVRRLPSHDDSSILVRYGVEANKYIVIHTGARHPLNQWSVEKFVEVSLKLISRGVSKIILFVDHSDTSRDVLKLLPEKFVEVLSLCPMDDFDVLLSNAALMIGNDSGPKHLASVRGTPVLSVAIPRLNWQEWGQNSGGGILAKKVPCAGCGANHLSYCGKNAACIQGVNVAQVEMAAVEILESAGYVMASPSDVPNF